MNNNIFTLHGTGVLMFFREFTRFGLASLGLMAAFPAASIPMLASASGNMSINWQVLYAADNAGRPLSAGGALSIVGSPTLTVSAQVNNSNQVSSTGNLLSTYTITNISTNVFINWRSQTVTNAVASGFAPSNFPGQFYYDANVLIGGSFASVNDAFTCTTDPFNRPNPNCRGSQKSSRDDDAPSRTGLLAPGQQLIYTLSGNAFATTRFEPNGQVAIPGSLSLLFLGVAGLGFMRRTHTIYQ
jgi:hypothetical protein